MIKGRLTIIVSQYIPIILGVGLIFNLFVPQTAVAKYLPFSYWPPFTIETPLSKLLIWLLIVVCVGVCFALRYTSDPRWRLLWTGLTVYLATIVATFLFWSSYSLETINCQLILLALGAGLTASICLKSTERIALALCALCAIQSIYTLIYHYLHINDFMSGELFRAGGTLNQPNGVYTEMIVALPITIAFAVKSQQSWKHTGWMLIAALMLAALILSWDRGGIIALGFSITWLIYRLTNSRKKVLISGLVLTTIFLFCFTVRSHGPINKISSSQAIQSRFTLWRRGCLIFKRHWISGVGVGALNIPVTTRLRAIPGIVIQSTIVEPKNLLLHWMDEMGVGGGILFLLIAGTLYRNFKTEKSPLGLGIAAAWISIGIAGFFDTPFGEADRFYGNAIIGFLFGATLYLPPHQQRNDVDDVSSLRTLNNSISVI